MTTMTKANRTDRHGVRYFHDYNGSRVDYPTGTRFGDGYVQPRIASVADNRTQPEQMQDGHWRVLRLGRNTYIERDGDSPFVCDTQTGDSSDAERAEAVELAEEIVRRYQNHASLVAALENCVILLGVTSLGNGSTYGSPIRKAAIDALSRVRG